MGAKIKPLCESFRLSIIGGSGKSLWTLKFGEKSGSKEGDENSIHRILETSPHFINEEPGLVEWSDMFKATCCLWADLGSHLGFLALSSAFCT